MAKEIWMADIEFEMLAFVNKGEKLFRPYIVHGVVTEKAPKAELQKDAHFIRICLRNVSPKIINSLTFDKESKLAKIVQVTYRVHMGTANEQTTNTP